jgi:hypothetical protein
MIHAVQELNIVKYLSKQYYERILFKVWPVLPHASCILGCLKLYEIRSSIFYIDLYTFFLLSGSSEWLSVLLFKFSEKMKTKN